MISSARPIQFGLGVLLLSWTSLSAAVPTPESRIPHGFRFFMEADYFSSSANYDDGGDEVELPNGRYYKNYRSAFGAERWLSPDSSLLMELSTAFAESFGNGLTRKNSSVTEALLGYRRVWARTPFLLVPEFTGTFPFNRVDRNTENVLTGEGAIAAEAGIWAMYPISRARPYSRLGFQYRDGDRASHLLWQLGSQFKVGGSLFFLGAKGSLVVIDDAFADSPAERQTTTARVNGGSLKYYSVNPSDMSVHTGLIWELRKDWRLTAEYEQTLSGENTASGFTATLGLQWIMRTKSSYRPPPRRRRAPRVQTAPAQVEATTITPMLQEAPKPEVIPAPALAPDPKPKAKAKPTPPPAPKLIPVPPTPVKPKPVEPPPTESSGPVIRETPKAPLKVTPAQPHSSKLPPVKKASPRAAQERKPEPPPTEEDTSLKDIQNILGN